jgi:hypothetical protein
MFAALLLIPGIGEVSSRVMSSFRPLGRTPFLSRKFLVYAFLFLQGDAVLHAKTAVAGLAWHVVGTWQVAGNATPVRAGDAIQPASLLEPDETAGNHSITILLPDGQRILYECFTAADCARGFRVPSLIRRPDPFALDMLARIGPILSSRQDASRNDRHTQTARQEAVAVLHASHRVRVGGLIADLPNGTYTYDLRPRSREYSPQFRLTLQKTTHSIEIALPRSGLYDITITDALNAPRVNLLLAAISPAHSADLELFRRARATMETWNDDYAGWPIDDFLRAYLESLVESARH